MDYDIEKVEYYVYAMANTGKAQYRPMTALDGGANTFIYNLDECDGTECVPQEDLFCAYDDYWDPVCGCDDVTYSNYGVAACNNIFFWIEGSCETSINLTDYPNFSERKLIVATDLMGREIQNFRDHEIIILIFDDGTIKKLFIN